MIYEIRDKDNCPIELYLDELGFIYYRYKGDDVLPEQAIIKRIRVI